MTTHYVFIADLVQDANIFRPVVRFVQTVLRREAIVLVTDAFRRRDANGIWFAEISGWSSEWGVKVVCLRSTEDVAKELQDRTGMIFAAAESDFRAHQQSHDALLAAHPGFLRVTLQHGFECVGILHGRTHDIAHGDRIGFGADIVVSWFGLDRMTSIRRDQRSKIYVAGPSMLLDRDDVYGSATRAADETAAIRGLVCENLHSVRFRGEESRNLFLDAFAALADFVSERGGCIEIRPHPGGRFIEKNAVALPPGVSKNVAPLYSQDLQRFHFGISAPSSVLFDMIFAGMPVAVWAPVDGSIDTTNYAGLHIVRTPDEACGFAQDAYAAPDDFRQRQSDFVRNLGIPADSRERYHRLLTAVD